ncbi:MAG TPA: GntR family transcriptional regulator [Ilumatobacteraceae bacterium]|nr:GntR family transcriptional regulator [Ilumatobacteraceae bacterium]
MTTDEPLAAAGARGTNLSERLADSLRVRLEAGEWRPSERLPTEHELAAAYGVSRATVRTALRALDSRGLIVTRRGLGTFAAAVTSAVSANLQRLESMSETIRRLGRKPGSNFRSIQIRAATDCEIEALLLQPGTSVLATHREITADDDVVAYSHEVLPVDLLGADFDIRSVAGSMFGVMDAHGVVAASALTNLHASRGEEIGWGEHPADALFLLLEQTHFDTTGRAVVFSRTWFIEGRFQFTLIRVR